MGVGVAGVANYTNTSSGTATSVIASGGVGGLYEYVSFYSTPPAFNPASLFAAGEQGTWYDPSDLTTLFRDAAGTIPVTLSPMEQTVSLMRDKSGRNNHASQVTGAKRPKLSARVNLLISTDTLDTQSATTQATSYTLAFTGTGTVTLGVTATGVLSAGTNTFTATAGVLTLTVTGLVTFADLRPTNAGALLPAYQRVNTPLDYDTVGFPLYLKSDGISTAMSTSSINFTGASNMTVVTGVRKFSDATPRVLMELSSNSEVNPDTFGVLAPGSLGSASYKWVSAGALSVGAISATPYAAPITNVVTGLGDLFSTTTIRVNSTPTTDTTILDGGAYGNYPLYLFARNNTFSPINCNFYGAIIRGALTDPADLTSTEQYMATKTGITF